VLCEEKTYQPGQLFRYLGLTAFGRVAVALDWSEPAGFIARDRPAICGVWWPLSDLATPPADGFLGLTAFGRVGAAFR
jgi:hypothetical protein